MRPGLHQQFRLKTKFLGLNVGQLFNITQGYQGKVQEISRSAGRIKHQETVQSCQKTGIGSAGILIPFAARFLVVSNGNHRFYRLPFSQERFGNQRLDQLGNGGCISVVSAQRSPCGRIKPPLEQGAEDGWINGSPVHVCSSIVQGGQVIAG